MNIVVYGKKISALFFFIVFLNIQIVDRNIILVQNFIRTWSSVDIKFNKIIK